MPQPDSPTSPSVSPRRICEVDAVDGLDVADRRRSRPASTGKYFLSPRARAATSRSPLIGCLDRRSLRGRRSPARRPCSQSQHADCLARRPGRAAAARRAALEGVVAARLEAAARRPVERARAPAADHAQRLGLASSRASGSTAAAPPCTGAAATSNTSATGPRSTTRPAYITTTSSHDLGDDAEVVRDQQDRHAEPLAQLAQQLEDLRLDRHVERGRRLVGDQQLRVARERHRDHHALAHAAGQLVRVVVARAGRPRGCRRARASRPRAPRASFARRPRWSRTASAICSPTVKTGLSEVIGSWKIIEISLPRILSISRSSRLSEVAALEDDPALARRSRPGSSTQAHDRQRRHRLAASPTRRRRRACGPSSSAKSTPSTARIGPPVGVEPRAQVLDLEQRSAARPAS